MIVSFVGVFGPLSSEDLRAARAFFVRVAEHGQVLKSADAEWPPAGPGYLDLFSGAKGVANAVRSYGNSWVITFGLADGPEQDLYVPELKSEIFALFGTLIIFKLGSCPCLLSFFPSCLAPCPKP